MKLGAVTLAWAVCAVLAGPALAQAPETPTDPAKPVLQIKPAEWRPKIIHRSQLRPILKPVSTAETADESDVYVPPAQVIAVPAAASAPVQLASARSAAQPPATDQAPAAFQEFVGKFLGAGVEVALAPSPGEPPRRMSQVEISGDPSEFTIKWATMKIGADFKAETVKSSQQELTFRPTAVAGRYVAIAAPGAASAPDATAEFQGRTMTVTVSTALPSGVKSIQRYERTLTEQGMNVVFTRTESGRLVRQVNLTLSRSGGSIWRNL